MLGVWPVVVGHALIDAGRRVLFTRCSKLVQRLHVAHARRKFDELLGTSAVAKEAIKRIGWIYHVEGQFGHGRAAAPRGAEAAHAAAVEGAAPLAQALARSCARRRLHCLGNRLQIEQLACTDAAPRRRGSVNRQQLHRAADQTLGHGQEGLAILRQRVGRSTCSRGHEPGAVGRTQRARTVGLPARRAGSASRPPQQPHRRVVAAPLEKAHRLIAERLAVRRAFRVRLGGRHEGHAGQQGWTP